MFERRGRTQLEEALAKHLPRQRWFAAKSRKIRRVSVGDAMRLGPVRGEPVGYLCLIDVELTDGEPETYVLPLAARRVDDAPHDDPIAVVRGGEGDVLLVDGADDPAVRQGAARADPPAPPRGRKVGQPGRRARTVAAPAGRRP